MWLCLNSLLTPEIHFETEGQMMSLFRKSSHSVIWSANPSHTSECPRFPCPSPMITPTFHDTAHSFSPQNVPSSSWFRGNCLILHVLLPFYLSVHLFVFLFFVFVSSAEVFIFLVMTNRHGSWVIVICILRFCIHPGWPQNYCGRPI